MKSSRKARRRRRVVGVVLAFCAVLLAVSAMAPRANAGTATNAISIATSNGTGRSVSPGRSCSDGGEGAYWHYDYGTSLAPGKFSGLVSEGLVHLDLHTDLERYPNTDTDDPGGPYPAGANPRAWLAGEESHAFLLNERGSAKLKLVTAGGGCSAPKLAFDGSSASGSGTWAVVAGTGSYAQITGSGAFNLLTAEVNPGSDNALNLVFTSGSFTVPDPHLKVEVLSTYWGSLGTDYLTRRVTVVYKITNDGTGDAFGVNITGVASSTPGVTPMTTPPIALGDLRVGESRQLAFRSQFSLLNGPCKLVILGCVFNTVFTVNMPDALDVPHPGLVATVTAKAPTLPPPL